LGEADVPGELQVIERNVVRMVVLDADEHLLLFHTHDPVNPDLGQWWELPGGGIEPEETYQQAAVRELREETGILVEPGQVGPATSPGEAGRHFGIGAGALSRTR